MIIVVTAVATKSAALKLARLIVSKKFAACINIIKLEKSVYLWKGKTEEGKEHLLLIKTKKSLYSKLEKFMLANHPYELPEIVSLPVGKGYNRYLAWVFGSVR